MNAPRLQLDAISCRYGDLAVLEDISMTVRPGEFVSILGPSGSGKSTLFRLLTGARAPGTAIYALMESRSALPVARSRSCRSGMR